jgi:glutamyl-tRNA(Gln) amidotransferase subunit D
MEEKVALLKVHPNMMPEQFSFYKGYKGLVIEGTGLGQAPIGVPNEECRIHEKNLKAIKELVKNGTVVCMTTQCIYGAVQMHVYSNAIDLVNAGVIEAKMLPETALAKLAWLLKNNKKEAKELMQKDLRGELFDRIEDNTFLI